MKNLRKFLILVIIVSIVLTMFALVSAVTNEGYSVFDAKSIAGIVPFYTPKNDNDSHNDTSNLYTGYLYFKLFDDGAPQSGEHTIIIDATDSSKVKKLIISFGTITINGLSAHYISKWEAVNIDIYYFIVKGGPGFLTYAYDGSLSTDGRLFPPINNGGEHPTISHISIYYKNTTTETTTTTAATTTGTTTTGATTTTDTTTTGATTTTGTTTTGATTTTDTTTTGATTTTDTTTTGATTTKASEATMSRVTTKLAVLTENRTPLASVTTVTTPDPLTTLTDPNIPQTGENGSGNGLLIGLILLALAGALTVVIYRRKSVKQ